MSRSCRAAAGSTCTPTRMVSPGGVMPAFLGEDMVGQRGCTRTRVALDPKACSRVNVMMYSSQGPTPPHEVGL